MLPIASDYGYRMCAVERLLQELLGELPGISKKLGHTHGYRKGSVADNGHAFLYVLIR